MSRQSPMKGKNLGHREFIRCRLAFDFLEAKQIPSEELARKYYGELSSESFHKTFKRDRDALEKEGIYLVEQKKGPAKLWSLDREKSLADVSSMSVLERRIIAILLRAAQSNPETTQTNALGASVARIGQISSSGSNQLPALTPSCGKEILTTMAEALSSHTPVELVYNSLKDAAPVPRILYPYGMFSLGRALYVVGLRHIDGQRDAIHTYNLARAKAVTPLSNWSTYTVPISFKVSDYRLLPFEIGDEDEQAIEFHVDANALDDFTALARKRGELEVLKNGGAIWKGTTKDIGLAASWALEAGAVPVKPASLVAAWQQLIEGALNDN